MEIDSWIEDWAGATEKAAVAGDKVAISHALDNMLHYSEMTPDLMTALSAFEAANMCFSRFTEETASALTERLKAAALAAGPNGQASSLLLD